MWEPWGLGHKASKMRIYSRDDKMAALLRTVTKTEKCFSSFSPPSFPEDFEREISTHFTLQYRRRLISNTNTELVLYSRKRRDHREMQVTVPPSPCAKKRRVLPFISGIR
mmetsp:Transcript_30925/g.92685  ORF Transcript_30925/g.92685 Transcript_30925/m.92685 type:complete len:110 (-) Transcript_30925:718-1047(-)